MELTQVIEQLKWRAAIKKFDVTKKVSNADLDLLLEAVRLAPSSLGLQPWKFVVVTDTLLRQKISEAGYSQPQFLEASHLVVLCSRVDLSQDYIDEYIDFVSKTRNVDTASLAGYHGMISGSVKAKTPLEIENWNIAQLYIALGVLLTVCATGNIDACPMEGFDTAKCDDVLDLSGTKYRSRAICAIGYRADDDSSSKMDKVRFSKEQIIINK